VAPVSGERTVPILPCADLDVSVAFYQALGFECTYRQVRPNPHAVVELEDIGIHLFGMEGFDPVQSYGSAIVLVPDPDATYAAFAAGLRAGYGRLPTAGIPRILRPRKKHGTVSGFSVVDPGGNWLRVSRGAVGETVGAEEPTTGLRRVLENAARLGDSKGDEADALRLLDGGLDRFSDAPARDRVEALLYKAELAARSGRAEQARQALDQALAVELDEIDAALAAEIAAVREVVLGD
jgi:catechol 2,3-dioxygenase-like lactoylglutathione lyase family enzyme